MLNVAELVGRVDATEAFHIALFGENPRYPGCEDCCCTTLPAPIWFCTAVDKLICLELIGWKVLFELDFLATVP